MGATDWINANLIPNLSTRWGEFWEATVATIVMTLGSGVFIVLFGLFFGIILTVTREGGLRPSYRIFKVIDFLTNVFRSIPFIILMTALIPLTRRLVGTSIGVRGAIFPLVVGAIPFYTRQVESALSKVDPGLVEATLAMGDTTRDIIFNVYLRESVPQLIRGTVITLISLLSLTAMAGTVGAGGLGDFAVRLGHGRGYVDCTWAAVIILLLMVTVIQGAGSFAIRKVTHGKEV